MRGEKAHEQVPIALGFDPGWSRRWRNNFQVNRSFSKYISGCHVCEQVMICFGFSSLSKTNKEQTPTTTKTRTIKSVFTALKMIQTW